MLYELATHIDLQDQLREEVIAAGDPSFDDFALRLPLLDAVLKETLRLHPPILENHHEVLNYIYFVVYILTCPGRRN
jgi:cytochrome P450